MATETLAPQGALKKKYFDRLVGIQEHGGTDAEKRTSRSEVFDEVDHYLQAAMASGDWDAAQEYEGLMEYLVDGLKIF